MRSVQFMFQTRSLSSSVIKYFHSNTFQQRCLFQTSSVSLSTAEISSNKKSLNNSNKHREKSRSRWEEKADEYESSMDHEIYSKHQEEKVQITHKDVESWHDRVAFTAVETLRFFFDKFTGYVHETPKSDDENKSGEPPKTMTEKQWLRRIIFLESVAGVPGMVAGMTRHLRSLRIMKRDKGWIYTLLSEAENERMHLMTFLELRKPGWLFRAFVLLGQGVFFNGFFIAYFISPKLCHRFVGYLEEEAVITYTRCIKELEEGRLPIWSKTPAPEIAKKYWKLSDDAMMIDVLLAVRADEALHRETNHKFADVGPDAPNPLILKSKKESSSDKKKKTERSDEK